MKIFRFRISLQCRLNHPIPFNLKKYSTGRDMVLHITLRDIWSDMSDIPAVTIYKVYLEHLIKVS